MRVEGWNLSNVKYTFNDGVVSMVEPLIGSKPVSEYADASSACSHWLSRR